MKIIQHTAFYIAHDDDKDWLIHQINESKLDFLLSLKGLRGEIFSDCILQDFIDEEIRHDNFEISTANRNSLAASSSGEQRKALLTYIIAKKPDYIIIDNVFDSLDKDSVLSILSIIEELAATTLLMQVFNRKKDLLSFIETIYIIESRSLITRQDPGPFLATLNLQCNDRLVGIVPPPLFIQPGQNGALVKMNNVNVQYNGRPILQNICWEINAGEFWHLTGPNGSGKTTLLSLITGNSSKGYGQDLFLFGRQKGTGETVWEIKEKIGYFSPTMTLQFERQDSIEQMIISGLYDSVGLYVRPSGSQVQLARQWLLLIGMHEERNQPFRMISLVSQRMILIARAMVKHPALLILDEPSVGLNDEMTTLFVALINKIAEETRTAILYVSHREEKGLLPQKIFELSLSKLGSTGRVLK